jgi:hypothetical protein
MITEKGKDKRIEKFDYYQIKSIESFYAFQKTITTLSIGFLAIFVGFKPEKLNCELTKFLFFSTVLLFGLCILFSLITQYGELKLHRKSAVARANILIDYIENHGGNTSQSEYVKTNWLYKTSEKTTYFCLLLSILSLITYSYFLIFS